MEINLIIVLLFFLSCLQSILGVGILVIGTPILLLFNYNLPEILELLLPISIITSFTTLLIIKSQNKGIFKSIDNKINFYFFLICLPAIFFGLLLLNLFNHMINFKVFVALIILLSLVVKYFFNKKLKKAHKNIKKILMFTIGMIHGLTNSGGTILSLFFSNTNKSTINLARLNITYFYLLLAFFQFIIFLFFFKTTINLEKFFLFLIVALTGSFLGNILIKFLEEKLFKYIIEFLAISSAIFLLFK